MCVRASICGAAVRLEAETIHIFRTFAEVEMGICAEEGSIRIEVGVSCYLADEAVGLPFEVEAIGKLGEMANTALSYDLVNTRDTTWLAMFICQIIENKAASYD